MRRTGSSIRNDNVNQIDRLAGLEEGSELYDIRRLRPEFVEDTELCRESVLRPANDFGMSHLLRVALAARMARLLGCESLASVYDDMLQQGGPDRLLMAIAGAEELPKEEDAFILAMVRHADLVTKTPRNSTRADIERLQGAGLTNPQIVALSELIAFVNFEARIIVGLCALELVA
jgi:uncharacterized protein YciW